MKKKSGITMTSMVIYVVIFFAFSAFAVAVSTNYNHKTLMEKGNIFINEEFDKLQINLLSSGRKSTDVSNIGGKIVFSNDDEYRFSDGKVYKNDGICISNVTEFNVKDGADISTIGGYNIPSIDTNISQVVVNLKIEKYGVAKEFELFITAGDELGE